MAEHLGANYVQPKADKVLWALQQDPYVINALLERGLLLPPLKDDKLFYYATDSQTHKSSGTAFTTDESLIFSINPKLLLGLCVRNLIQHQFHFSRNKRVAD
ncbi:hypothetical protein HDK77DRAFT_483559 [Phyllosticta capitalensis]